MAVVSMATMPNETVVTRRIAPLLARLSDGGVRLRSEGFVVNGRAISAQSLTQVFGSSLALFPVITSKLHHRSEMSALGEATALRLGTSLFIC